LTFISENKKKGGKGGRRELRRREKERERERVITPAKTQSMKVFNVFRK
jgi:hypothetical protein